MLERVKENQILERVKESFDDAVAYDREWQTNAEEAFGFRDGWAQWSKEEKDILFEEGRPALTLNIVKSHIDLIKGLNEDIKKRYIAKPQGVEDSFLCEVINNVIYWLYQNYDFSAEEDNAYESALISGRGWVSLDYNIDDKLMQDIKLDFTAIPVHEVRMDPAARKRDLSDASYVFWDRWLSLEDFAIKYPKFEQKAREAFETNTWPTYALIDNLTPESGEWLNHDINDESDYSDPLDVSYFDSHKKQIRVAHMEYWKYKKQYHVFDLDSGKLVPVHMPWPQFKERFKKVFPNKQLRYETTTTKEVWWIQFCGGEILFHGKSPIEYPGFSLVPCFLFNDVSRRKGYHYGVVELMKDPQREINKRTSQTLNLYNQQVQPGVYAEAKAFVNVDQAEQSLKESGSITWLQDGAINQKRFIERTVPTFPSAVLQMGEYAREMVRHITGINPDLLGMNDKRQEAGIVVQLRQQQGMSILKPVFKAYSAMKEEVFKRLVSIVLSHMPSSQILKILGEPGRYQIDASGNLVDQKTGLQANMNDVANLAYDMDSEPESDSMTQDALELATFMEMGKNGIPVAPEVMISKTNLPISEKLAWIKYIENQQEASSQAAQEEMQMKRDEMKMKYDVDMKKLDNEMQIATAKLVAQEDKDVLKASLDVEKLKLQEARDKQTVQVKVMQIVTQAALGKKKEEREWVDMMLDADIAKKRLILDTVEVMAMSKNQQDAESVKAVLDMYKLALDDKNMTKERELKFAQAVMDAYVKMDIEKGKEKLEKEKMASQEKTAKITADAQAKEADADRKAAKDSEKLQTAAKLKTESEKNKTTKAVAKTASDTQKSVTKSNNEAAAKQADKAAKQAKKDKPL